MLLCFNSVTAAESHLTDIWRFDHRQLFTQNFLYRHQLITNEWMISDTTRITRDFLELQIWARNQRSVRVFMRNRCVSLHIINLLSCNYILLACICLDFWNFMWIRHSCPGLGGSARLNQQRSWCFAPQRRQSLCWHQLWWKDFTDHDRGPNTQTWHELRVFPAKGIVFCLLSMCG